MTKIKILILESLRHVVRHVIGLISVGIDTFNPFDKLKIVLRDSKDNKFSVNPEQRRRIDKQVAQIIN